MTRTVVVLVIGLFGSALVWSQIHVELGGPRFWAVVLGCWLIFLAGGAWVIMTDVE
jgi:hypothetical protein